MVSEKFQSTGFDDYDLLPEQLKKQMEALVKKDTIHRYNFYYFFKTDDINHHYYLNDRGLKVVAEMPVTNERALDLIDEKINNIMVKRHGRYEAHDNISHQKYNLALKHKFCVFYVMPEGTADYSQLRVAIMEDTLWRDRSKYPENIGLVMYDLDEVDSPPRPVRGLDYFQQAVIKEAELEEVFVLFDTGTVTIEFAVVGDQVEALDIVQGFSNWNSSYEAYQADSEFMKAVHNAKVRWKPGLKDKQSVKTKMKITFKVDSAKVSSVVHQLSSL